MCYITNVCVDILLKLIITLSNTLTHTVGKSALVNRGLKDQASERGIIFASGKFGKHNHVIDIDDINRLSYSLSSVIFFLVQILTIQPCRYPRL